MGSGEAIGYPAEAYPIVSGFRSMTNPNGSTRYRSHGGVDILAPKGISVLAAEDGVVRRVRLGAPVGGNMVHQDTARMGGWMELRYAHLDTVLVREGDVVTAGQVIGTVGNTGDWVSENEAPHLHFAVLGPFGRLDPEDCARVRILQGAVFVR
jgi:murein DD-endopeptidase MepM/ murein hydrolase activator NlpD